MELPKDRRYIRLKHAGRCQSCSTRLAAGVRAHWSPSSKKVWCADCATGARPSVKFGSDNAVAGPRDTGTNRARQIPHTSPTARPTPWQQLCGYAQRCIEAEAAESLVPYVKQNSLWFLHRGEEGLVVGRVDSTTAPRGLADKLRSRSRSIIYGWPTIVLTDRDHVPKVAPLFAVQVEPVERRDGQYELHATMEPEFNLAITASGVYDPSVSEEISDLVSHGLPFGDADAFGAVAARTAGLLGTEILTPLDARGLDSTIGPKQGLYNAAISVVAEWPGYTSTVRGELRELRSRRDWSNTAAAHLIPNAFTQGHRKRPPSGPLAAPLQCNQSQEETLQRLRREPLTVVTGPPGTGKTQLVVNAVANAWLDGDKVLVTSTNNGAVDVAANRALADVGGGLLIRTGNHDMRGQVPDRIAAASAQAAMHLGDRSAARARLQRVATGRARLVGKLARLDELDRRLLQVATELQGLRLARSAAAGTLWANASPPGRRISSQAIERRAGRLLRTWFFRHSRAQHLRRRLGCLATAPLQQLLAWARHDQRIARLTDELASGRAQRNRLKSALGEASDSLREASRQWEGASLHAIRADTASRISAGADQLAAFGRIPANRDRFRRAISNSSGHLRGWACTALTAHSNFPLEAGLFDLVIVDEASQCSLAAVLPLAYRAKRLAVVGDPYQLNPSVSLSDGLLQQIAHQAGFDNDDLRGRGIHHKDGSAYSAFNIAASPQEPLLLDEHYRCHPRIARWFNQAYYQGDLTVLTDVSAASQLDRHIYWRDVDGAAERPATGSWLNRAEAQQAVSELRGLIEAGYKTVGVLTPFTAQARLIDQLANGQFDRDSLDDIDFVSGTAHRLQGDAREAIVISSVLSPSMSGSGARWIEKERNLLNVAVSRAKRALIVLGHPLVAELGTPTLASLRAYLRGEAARDEGSSSPSVELRTDSTAEKCLLDAMQLGELAPYAKLDVEGYELDFALLEQGIKLDIEVDGDQHLDARGRQRRQDMARDRVLTGLGWTVLRIPAWRCHEEIDSVMDEIRAFRDQLLEKAASRAL